MIVIYEILKAEQIPVDITGGYFITTSVAETPLYGYNSWLDVNRGEFILDVGIYVRNSFLLPGKEYTCVKHEPNGHCIETKTDYGILEEKY